MNADALPVLLKAREALGGDTKLSSIRTVVISGQTRQVRGDSLVPVVFEINMELPDKYARRDETPMAESGYSTSGFSGDDLIQLPVPAAPGAMPGRAAGAAMSPEQMAQTQAAQRVARVGGLKQDFTRWTLGLFATSLPSYPVTFTRIGTAESPQGKADVLQVNGPNNFTARLFIDQEKHLPIMISWTPPRPPQAASGLRTGGAPVTGAPGTSAPVTSAPVTSAPGTSAPVTSAPGTRSTNSPTAPPAPEFRLYFADYRDTDGVMWPYRIRRATGADTTEETTIDRYKLNAKIDPKKFEVVK